jgi:hypothetical protein
MRHSILLFKITRLMDRFGGVYLQSQILGDRRRRIIRSTPAGPYSEIIPQIT